MNRCIGIQMARLKGLPDMGIPYAPKTMRRNSYDLEINQNIFLLLQSEPSLELEVASYHYYY